MDADALTRAIGESLPSGSGTARLAPKVLTLRCGACATSGGAVRTLGAVFATTVGPLLRVDRRGMPHVVSGEPAGRRRLKMWWLLAEPFTLDVEEAWFAICDRHGRRKLPPQEDLADAARSARVELLDV